jgi:hypothetical protein
MRDGKEYILRTSSQGRKGMFDVWARTLRMCEYVYNVRNFTEFRVNYYHVRIYLEGYNDFLLQ